MSQEQESKKWIEVDLTRVREHRERHTITVRALRKGLEDLEELLRGAPAEWFPRDFCVDLVCELRRQAAQVTTLYPE